MTERIPLPGAPGAPPAPPSDVTLEETESAAVELGAAYELAAAELGFVSASWLFVREVAAVDGEAGVVALRDALGQSFSVLHAVANRWLAGDHARRVETGAVVDALTGVRRVLVVGLEADHLDALSAALPPDVRIGLVTYRLLRVDWSRVVANYGGRVELVDMGEFQTWAGSRAALLTFVYGSRGALVTVLPAFLRVTGPDVRTQFREIVGWDVLGEPPDVYPRHLVETQVSELTVLVGRVEELARETA